MGPLPIELMMEQAAERGRQLARHPRRPTSWALMRWHAERAVLAAVALGAAATAGYQLAVRLTPAPVVSIGGVAGPYPVRCTMGAP